MTDRPASQRPIRSYVLRQGRVSNAQRRAHESLLSAVRRSVFGRGSSTSTSFSAAARRAYSRLVSGWARRPAAIAAAHPENDYLALEVHTPGVGSLLKSIAERSLSNVRIVQHDAVEVLEHMIAPGTLDGVHLFFPDPWPKKRHHKRRLIQPSFVALLASRVKPGGYVHVATDWEEYAQQMLQVLSAEPLLKNTSDAYAPRPDYRPLTKFEQRGLKLGHGVWDIVFRRRSSPLAPGDLEGT